MAKPRVDYNALAPNYNRRYDVGSLPGIAEAVRELAAGRDRVLEAGCGTGRWLEELGNSRAFGIDASPGMIAQAAGKGAALAVATANELPFRGPVFDVIYCVNAFHHFHDGRAFVHEAFELLRPGGVLAVIGIDPRLLRERRYVYTYFEGAYERDLQRYPSFGEQVQWMLESGLERVDYRVVERTDTGQTGESIWKDPFLPKDSHSLFALLTEEEYRQGLDRMRAALKENGPELRFRAEVDFGMVAGYKGL